MDERTGEVKKRYINRMRFVTFALQKVSHKQALGEVPKGPPRSLKDKTDKLDQDLLAKMRNVSLAVRTDRCSTSAEAASTDRSYWHTALSGNDGRSCFS